MTPHPAPPPLPHSHPGAGPSLRWPLLGDRAGRGTAPPRTRPRPRPPPLGAEFRLTRLRPARARACVTGEWSPAVSAAAVRRPRLQRPSSVKSRLPQTNAQWNPAWLGKPRPLGGGPHEFSPRRATEVWNVRNRPTPGEGPPCAQPPVDLRSCSLPGLGLRDAWFPGGLCGGRAL